MITNRINKRILFLIEGISCILGGISTFIITLFTISLAKEKQQRKIHKIIAVIPLVALFLAILTNNLLKDANLNKAIPFYVIFSLANIILILIQNKLFEMEDSNKEVVVSKTKASKKPIIVVGVFLIFVFILVISLLLWADTRQIKDTNGADNYLLQTISDSDLIGMNASFTASAVEHGTYGKRSGVSQKGVADYDVIKYSSKCASGISVMQATKVSKEVLTLQIDNKVKTGNCKLVIVVDGGIYSEIPLNSSNTIELKNMQGKEVFVVIGCESANLNLEISRTQTDE